MKKIQFRLKGTIMTLSAAAFSLCAYADNDTMVVTTTNGPQSKIELATISRITFDDGKMLVATPDGNREFALTDIDDISFDLVITGIDDITASLGNDIEVSITNGTLTASTATGTPLMAHIYSINGALLSSVTGNSTLTIDLTTLQTGAYIVRINQKTIKFIR